MINRHKVGLGLAAVLTVALVVPAFADGAADFQTNVVKAKGTLDDIAKLIDNIHARVAAGGGGGGTAVADGGGAGAAEAMTLVGNRCRCHTAGNAPKLTHIGADPTHTAMWIAQYARNPKGKNPNSKMPAQRNVPQDEMRKIAAYLASQK